MLLMLSAQAQINVSLPPSFLQTQERVRSQSAQPAIQIFKVDGKRFPKNKQFQGRNPSKVPIKETETQEDERLLRLFWDLLCATCVFFSPFQLFS